MNSSYRFGFYLLIVLGLLLAPLPQSSSEQRPAAVRADKRVVTVSIIAPVPPKPVKKAVPPKPKPKPKPKKVVKPKPKPKKVVKPEPKPEPVALPPEEKVVEVAPTVAPEPEPEPPVSPQAAPSPTTDVVADERERYFAQVYATIAEKKRYPKRALRFRHEGSVEVLFSVDAAGKVITYEITRSSGYRTLDGATEKLFRRLEAFAPPPKGVEVPLEMRITINYTIGG